jgi:transposase
MAIVGGLDIHRAQITFEWSDSESGELRRGRIGEPDRVVVRRWLAQFAGQRVDLALEGCTGWRYIVEEIQRAGFVAHVAEPAETQASRGRKRRAKTDRTDAALLRRLLVEDRLPESWIPPTHVLEARSDVRLYKALVDTRTEWLQRMHAVLFHHGVAVTGELTVAATRSALLNQSDLSAAGRRQLAVGYSMIDHINIELPALKRDLSDLAKHQPGCRALRDTQFGVGPLTSVAIWAELGDCRRFSSSDQAVRHTGLDVTIRSSDGKLRGGPHLSRQGPPALRWALYEAGKCASRSTAPDYDYYQQIKARCGGNRAAMSVGRKIVRRCYHTLRELGDKALEPVN